MRKTGTIVNGATRDNRNSGLGLFGDDHGLLAAAIADLKKGADDEA